MGSGQWGVYYVMGFDREWDYDYYSDRDQDQDVIMIVIMIMIMIMIRLDWSVIRRAVVMVLIMY